MKTRLCQGLLWTGAGVLALTVACSEQSNVMPSGTNFSLGSGVAPGAAAPSGPYERGQVDPASQLDPRTQGPRVRVVSPARGAQIAGNSATLKVKVTDPNGVSSVTIGGKTAQSLGNGEYSAALQLENGVNWVPIEATDSLGNKGDGCSTIFAGSFQSIDQLLSKRAGISLSNPGLVKFGGIADKLAKNIDLEPLVMAKDPLLDSWAATIRPRYLIHGSPQINLRGEPGGALVTVKLNGIDLGVLVDTLFNVNARLIADSVTLVGHAKVNPNQAANAKTILGLEIANLKASFTNFKVKLGSSLGSSIVSLLNGTVRKIVEKKLEVIVKDTITDKLKATIAGIDTPITLPVNVPLVGPTSIDLQFAVNSANGDASTGLGLSAGLKVTPTTIGIPNATSLVSVRGTTALPNVIGGDDFAVGLSSDALNGVMHAFWMAGAARIRLDGAHPDPNAASPLALRANLLYPFLPQIRGIAPDAGTPLVVEATMEAPPTARFGRNGVTAELNVSELQVKVLIDYMDGKPPLEIFTLRTSLRANADIAVSNGKIRIDNIGLPSVCSDLTNEPVTDLADAEIERFLNAILPTVLDRFKTQIPEIPIPALPFGLELKNPRLEYQPDFLIVRGRL